MPDTVWGDILRVDLTSGTIKREPISRELKLNFIGGRGINSKILYDELKPGTDPLSPQNVLIFGTGPLSGTSSPASGRWTVTAKSPETGIHGDANGGGHWAPQLKYTGIQHIVIHGKADKPVYLAIDDDEVEIRDASHLWGKDCWETEKIIRDEWRDPRVQVVTIGPAGENLVKFACILTWVTSAAGRTGMGAVMGSKNLKAIAVRGTKGLKIARPEQFRKAVLEANRLILTHPNYKTFAEFGTPGLGDALYDSGELTVFNHRQSQWEGNTVIGQGRSKQQLTKYTTAHRACFGCPLGCKHHYEVKDGPYAGTVGDGPEIPATGGMVFSGINEFTAGLRVTTLTNQWGIDTLTIPYLIAFAMDLYHRGIITKEDTDGIELEFGNHEALMEMMRKIVFREGFGNILAEGIASVAKKFGKEAEYLAAQIKGLNMGSADYRTQPGQGLSWVTSTRGADHLRGYPTCETVGVMDAEVIKERFGTTELPPRLSYEGKAKLVVWQQHFNAVQDIINTCRFTGEWLMAQRLQPRHYAAILSAATGIDFSGDDLMKAGERTFNVEAAFNHREAGLTRSDDVLPKRFFEEPLPDGPWKGAVVDWDKFEKMKDDYYELRGWDVELGIPSRKKLEELGLKYIADELEAIKGRVKKTASA